MSRKKSPQSGPPSSRKSSSLVHLVVSPERAAWILERYPPTETGRPMILATEYHARSRTRSRNDSAAAEIETDAQAGEPSVDSLAAD
jgi:hypothetical protein